ncbi:hypothetical protein BJF90_15030 [Pseudonocardia sp. CNS-004]|nr:hypothetical protein BJF90_15030 [Pseudonocardia sp. CNS-004]
MNLRRRSNATLPRSASRSLAPSSLSFISGSMNSTLSPLARSRHRYCQFTHRPPVSRPIGGCGSRTTVAVSSSPFSWVPPSTTR